MKVSGSFSCRCPLLYIYTSPSLSLPLSLSLCLPPSSSLSLCLSLTIVSTFTRHFLFYYFPFSALLCNQLSNSSSPSHSLSLSLLLHFSAGERCGYCKRLKPNWDSLFEKANAQGYNFKMGHLNCNQHMKVCVKFNAFPWPSIKLYVHFLSLCVCVCLALLSVSLFSLSVCLPPTLSPFLTETSLPPSTQKQLLGRCERRPP